MTNILDSRHNKNYILFSYLKKEYNFLNERQANNPFQHK